MTSEMKAAFSDIMVAFIQSGNVTDANIIEVMEKVYEKLLKLESLPMDIYVG